MSDDLLIDDEPDVELDPEEDDLPLEEIEDKPKPESEASAVTVGEPALMQVLPADFPLPALIKFVPNAVLKANAEHAAAYALRVNVMGPEGLQRADVALTALRASQKAIEEHFAEPKEIANRLHKSITGTLADWLAPGKAAVETVGRKVYQEQRRLEQIATDERRKAQAEADRLARETAKREAEEAERAAAPAPVVEELRRQAEQATAAPVVTARTAAPMRGTAVVTTWKARIAGTDGSAEPNPSTTELTPAQAAQVRRLLQAILENKAPLTAIDLNWRYLNSRAKADRSTLQIAGIEAFEEGGVRAKGSRAK